MLVLTRRTNESLLIGGNIRICIMKIGDGVVRIGVDAPTEIPVLRDEVAVRDNLVLADLVVQNHQPQGDKK